MSTDGSSSTGVKSLRAMFENAKSEVSTPEHRGRPAADSSTPGTSTRPLSKVHASFIAVEPSSQLARKIRVDTPDSAGTMRPGSTGDSFSKDFDDVKSMPSMTNESASATSASTTPSRMDSGTIGTSPPSNLSHVYGMHGVDDVDNTSPPSRKTQTEKQRSPPPNDVLQTLAANLRTPSKPKDKTQQPRTSAPISKPLEKPKPDDAPAVKPIAPKTNATSTRPPPIVVEKPKVATSASSRSLKPPASQPQTPTSARSSAERSHLSTYGKVASERGGNKAATAKRQEPAKSPKPAAKSGGTRSATGFVKPRPKSPTRPIKLPAHLVAPTASSAAKHGQASPVQTRSTVSRRTSMASSSSRMSLSQSFRRDGAASFGPPPNQEPSQVLIRPCQSRHLMTVSLHV